VEHIEKRYDVAVIGGGMAGLCAAIAAAREGAQVALIHNRPVLGGNASSEIRMHIVGADWHASMPNRRETGILEEILLEHKRRNPENSWPLFDSILWEKAAFQKNLTLYLNTHITDADMDGDKIRAVRGIQQTTEKRFTFTADIFVDATGDATIAALAGADAALGRESRDTYGEPHAPEAADHCTMGNSLMMKSRDMGHPVPFIRPFWANVYTEEDMQHRSHSEISSGYWWIELGGGVERVIEDGEIIRDELLKAVFGVWDHIKNGGDHGAENYELEWVGFLPGKRESRRVLGDYVLTEPDCGSGARFDDAVAYGGWPMDVHVVEGFRRKNAEPNYNLPIREVYAIPYRCFYSRNIPNLMMAGRSISCSHMAFASTRVMATCAVGGQAVGVAAAMAVRKGVSPREVGSEIKVLQQKLLRQDCYLPGIVNEDPLDLARGAHVSASCSFEGMEPGNAVNGWGRTIGESANCWQADGPGAWIELRLDAARTIGEIQILFDSNLSRQIMISLSEAQLRTEPAGTPPELVKDFTLEFLSGGEIVNSLTVQGNYQRRCIVRPEKPVLCDGVRLRIDATHGTKAPKVFEIRLYEADEITLVRPAPEHAEEVMRLREELLRANDADSFAGCSNLQDFDDYDGWLDLLDQRENPDRLPEGSVPSSAYLAVRASDGRIVGVIDLRHHIDHPILGLWGGHIGYTVRPSERGKGYAKEMLRLNLKNCRARGLNKVMITCSPANPASERTIIANGGTFEKDVSVEGETIRRYWITL